MYLKSSPQWVDSSDTWSRISSTSQHFQLKCNLLLGIHTALEIWLRRKKTHGAVNSQQVLSADADVFTFSAVTQHWEATALVMNRCGHTSRGTLERKLEILQYKHQAVHFSCDFFLFCPLYSFQRWECSWVTDSSFLLRVLLPFPCSNL